MAENAPPVPPNNSQNDAGQPFYDKTRAHLKDLLAKKRILEQKLIDQEQEIYKRETEYLEETPAGNIITGFDGYTKGSGVSGGGGARRKGNVVEGNRVFSRSSISWNVTVVGALSLLSPFFL